MTNFIVNGKEFKNMRDIKAFMISEKLKQVTVLKGVKAVNIVLMRDLSLRTVK